MRLWEICIGEWWLRESERCWETTCEERLAVCQTLSTEAPRCGTGYLKNELQERFTQLSLELPAPSARVRGLFLLLKGGHTGPPVSSEILAYSVWIRPGVGVPA